VVVHIKESSAGEEVRQIRVVRIRAGKKASIGRWGVDTEEHREQRA
jgi:hypothetical protein